MIEQEQIARGRIQTPQPGHHRRRLVLVELRIQVPLAIARPIGREDDAVVGAVDRAHVVVVRRLIRHLGDDRRLVLPQPRHLVQLPVVGGHLVLPRRPADDHAEHGLGAIPVDRGLADGDGAGALQPCRAVARGSGEVLQRAARIPDPEVAAARRVRDRSFVVGEHRADGGEVGRRGHLRDEQDGRRRQRPLPGESDIPGRHRDHEHAQQGVGESHAGPQRSERSRRHLSKSGARHPLACKPGGTAVGAREAPSSES